MDVEKENTWRTLQGSPLAVTSVRCRFGFHTWTKWSEMGETIAFRKYRVWRFCIHCNLPEDKVISEHRE